MTQYWNHPQHGTYSFLWYYRQKSFKSYVTLQKSTILKKLLTHSIDRRRQRVVNELAPLFKPIGLASIFWAWVNIVKRDNNIKSTGNDVKQRQTNFLLAQYSVGWLYQETLVETYKQLLSSRCFIERRLYLSVGVIRYYKSCAHWDNITWVEICRLVDTFPDKI